MRKERRRMLVLAMIFLSGGVLGYLMGWITEVATSRSGYGGGEALVLPAMILLFILGWRGSREHHRSLYERASKDETRQKSVIWRR